LELLKEVVPGISRVGILSDADTRVKTKPFKYYEPAAHALKIQLQPLEVRGPTPDLAEAFQTAVNAGVRTLIIVRTPLLIDHRKQIAELAIKNRLPLMAEGNDFVEAGCLMSYAASEPESFRRAATYVDKILKGRKPADLPVEQPTKFEFIINLTTAKQIGLTISAERAGASGSDHQMTASSDSEQSAERTEEKGMTRNIFVFICLLLTVLIFDCRFWIRD